MKLMRIGGVNWLLMVYESRFLLVSICVVNFQRPNGFSNLKSAVKYMLDSTTLRNKESANITTKTQLAVNAPLLLLYLLEFLKSEEMSKIKDVKPYERLRLRLQEIIKIHYPNVSLESLEKMKKSIGKHLLKWRVNLLESEKHWVSWFSGITNQFLNQSNHLKLNFYIGLFE